MPTTTTTLNAVEVGRLAIIQKHALRLIERRVEALDLTHDHHYSVTVTQQITLPQHLTTESVGVPLPMVLIPLGYFRKARLPDLKVYGPDGVVLPLLSRGERAKTIAVMFTSGWESKFLAGIDTNAPERSSAIAIWDDVQSQIGLVVTALRVPARERVRQLQEMLVARHSAVQGPLQRAIRTILTDQTFWSELEALAESTLLIAKSSGVIGGTYVYSVEYTERFSYEPEAFTAENRLAATWWHKVLAWLGWIAVPIFRTVANVGQAASFWVVQTTPDGVEPLRAFWSDAADELRPNVVTVSADRIVASRYMDSAAQPGAHELTVEMQMAPSAAVGTAALLAVLVWFIGTYIYQSVPEIARHSDQQANLIALGSLFAAVPAAVAGVLAYAGRPFARRVSRGPRLVLSALAAQAGFLAIVIGLKNVNESWVEASSLGLLTYAFAAAGVLGYIQFGPRWRKSDRSRLPRTTTNTLPERCRAKQVRWASAFGMVWVLATVVIVRCEVVLQHDRIFTSAFPGNVWRAWWSWFGL